MIEIFESFEQVAGRLSPVVLIVPGVAMVLVGLAAWLAGMCLRQIVLALFGAVVAALAGFYLSMRNSVAGGVAACGGAAFGIILPRLFLALLLAVFGMAVGFGVLAKPHLLGQGTLSGTEDLEPNTERFPVGESLGIVQDCASDVAARIGFATRQLVLRDWLVIVAVGVGLLVLSLYFEWSMGALTCSLLGTGLIFAGLMLLLMYKGSAPTARVEQQGTFYALVLLGMAAFGTLEQMLVCRQPKRAVEKPQAEEETKSSWRTH